MEPKQKNSVLALAAAVLLAAAVMTFPYALNLTWAMPGADSDRTLTYRPGKLTWDSGADIDENGAIHLAMFRLNEDSLTSGNGTNIIAPGTGKTTRIRLLNASGGKIRYRAVLYRLDDGRVPLQAGLEAPGAKDADPTLRPEGVRENQVVDAITGELGSSSAAAVSLSWRWDYGQSPPGDQADTLLGTQNTPPEVRCGLYLVVEDGNTGGGSSSQVIPKTGDDSHLLWWMLVFCASLSGLLYLAPWERCREWREHEN